MKNKMSFLGAIFFSLLVNPLIAQKVADIAGMQAQGWIYEGIAFCAIAG